MGVYILIITTIFLKMIQFCSKNTFNDLVFFWVIQFLLLIVFLSKTIHLAYDIYILKFRKKNFTKTLPIYVVHKNLKKRYKCNRSKLFIIFCLWILFFLLLILFPDVNDVRLKVFNPYRILNVKKGDDSGTIKRAYRKASLKWHPDK